MQKEKDNILFEFNLNKEEKKSASIGFYEEEKKHQEKKERKSIVIDYHNAVLNTIVIGATGSGKTLTVLVPALERLIKNKTPGLVIDIKRTLGDYVDYLARKHGFSDNIIELSPYSTGMSVNILNGIGKDELKELIRNSINVDIKGKDPYWATQGFKIIEDVIDVYYVLKETAGFPEFTFMTLAQILNNRDKAKNLYRIFKEKAYRHPEFYNITERIESYAFHIFKDHPDKARQDEQLSWTKTNVFSYFENLSKSNYVNFNDLSNKEFKLDFKKLFYEKGKIVLLKLNFIDGGPEIEFLSNFIRQKMIKDLISYKVPSEKRKYTFVLIDEFQTVVSFKEEGFNDERWFDKSREFKNIQIVAAQSLSALYSRHYNHSAVNSLLNNCRHKIVLNNTDPETITYFDRYREFYPEEYVSPIKLELGEGLLFSFNYKDKKNIFAKIYLELQKEFLNIKLKEETAEDNGKKYSVLYSKIEMLLMLGKNINIDFLSKEENDKEYLEFKKNVMKSLENYEKDDYLDLSDDFKEAFGDMLIQDAPEKEKLAFGENEYGFMDITSFRFSDPDKKNKGVKFYNKKVFSSQKEKIFYQDLDRFFDYCLITPQHYMSIINEELLNILLKDKGELIQFLNTLEIKHLIVINPIDAFIWGLNGLNLTENTIRKMYYSSLFFKKTMEFKIKIEKYLEDTGFKLKDELFKDPVYIFRQITHKIDETLKLSADFNPETDTFEKIPIYKFALKLYFSYYDELEHNTYKNKFKDLLNSFIKKELTDLYKEK